MIKDPLIGGLLAALLPVVGLLVGGVLPVVVELRNLLLGLCLYIFMEVAESPYFAHTGLEQSYFVGAPQLEGVGLPEGITEEVEGGEVEVLLLTLPGRCLLLRLGCPVIHQLHAGEIVFEALRPILTEGGGVFNLAGEGEEV